MTSGLVSDIVVGMNEGAENRENLIRRVKASFAKKFGPDTNLIGRMEGYRDALTELSGLCDRIQRSDNPESEIRSLTEILVQKDEEWEKNDAADDIRLLFFKLYFNNFDFKTKTLDMVRSHRFDPDFVRQVLKELDRIRKRSEFFLGAIEKDLLQERKYQDDFNRNFADVL